MTVKDIIRKMLTRRKMTQTDLADVAGFKNQSNIAMILKNGNTMRLESLLRMADALDCDVLIRDNWTEETFKIE